MLFIRVAIGVAILGAVVVAGSTSGLGLADAAVRVHATTSPTRTNAAPTTATPTAPVIAPHLYVDPNSLSAKEVATLTAAGNLTDAATIRQISSQPGSIWLTGWATGATLSRYLQRYVDAARADGSTLTFVTYAIPNRDCGGYSAGGLSASAYLDWNRVIASTLTGTGANIIVEPDAIAMLGKSQCDTVRSTRLPLLNQAVGILAGAGLKIYLDAGHAGWVAPSVMAPLLQQAGVAHAAGFSTNVASFNSTATEVAYAGQLSGLLGGKHFVIDVSRNGAGSQPTWCNPPGAALGQNPRLVSGQGALDALLWIKSAGVSDGTCNWGPPAGTWWESYALALVKARGL